MSLYPDIWWPPSSGQADRDKDDNTASSRGGGGVVAGIHNRYGSLHNNDHNDLENNKYPRGMTAPPLHQDEPLLPIVYSPSLVDNNSSNNNNDDIVRSDISSDDDDDEESIEIIEQPHRTMGLVFFDFIRCIAISANVRCINTQLMPVFMSMGGGGNYNNIHHIIKKNNNSTNQLDMLNVALRLFISLFSILLILVEFPDVFPFLQHAPPSQPPAATITPLPSNPCPLSSNTTSSMTSSSSATTHTPPPTPPSPPLYITNWIPRGIFYIFLSIICLEQSLVVRAFDNERHVNSYSRFFDGFFIVVSAYIMAATGVVYILLGTCCCQRIMERVRRDEKEKWRLYNEKILEMELQEEDEDEEEDGEEVNERRKLLSSASSSLEWANEVKQSNGKRRKIRMTDCEDEEQGEIHNALGWIQAYCFGRCCWQRWLRWWRRNRWQQRKKHRRLRRQHQKKGCGLCQPLRCRTVDWRL